MTVKEQQTGAAGGYSVWALWPGMWRWSTFVGPRTKRGTASTEDLGRAAAQTALAELRGGQQR